MKMDLPGGYPELVSDGELSWGECRSLMVLFSDGIDGTLPGVPEPVMV